MFLLYLILAILASLLVVGFVTQVAIPMYFGTPLFPFFNKTETTTKVKEAIDQLEEVAELEQLGELQEEINRRKAQLKKD